jgi:hypothetical protein
VKARTYPKVQRFAYGQVFPQFPRVMGPLELLPEVEYLVEINMGDRFAKETFTLTRDGKLAQK